MKGKVFLITGATSGTGLEASKILLNKGARVVMLNRNPIKSQNVIFDIKRELGEYVDVSYIELDLGNLESVKKAAQEVLNSIPRIDTLICNGAIAQVPKRELTVDGHESQLGVNHYGHFALQALLLPLIEKSKGRIVVVGSEGYKMGLKTINFNDINWDKNYTPNHAYSQSKLAQMMSAYELQDRLTEMKKTDIKVYVCHPGASATSLISTNGSHVMRLVWWLMTKSPLVQSAEKGAYPLLMCSVEEDLNPKGFYGPTGRNYWTGPVGECKLESHAIDKEISKRLWNLSEEVTGVSWKL